MPIDPKTGMPTAPKPYATAPLPPDSSGPLAEHAYRQAVAALRGQRADTLRHYGMRMGPGGKTMFDPRNTYGAFQMQGREQGQQMSALVNAQAGAGISGVGSQGGSLGLASQQRNEAKYEMGRQQSDLLREYQDKMDAIRLGLREAKWQNTHTRSNATLQAIMNAIAGGQFTPAAPVGG
jgi:hypothetical protein